MPTQRMLGAARLWSEPSLGTMFWWRWPACNSCFLRLFLFFSAQCCFLQQLLPGEPKIRMDPPQPLFLRNVMLFLSGNLCQLSDLEGSSALSYDPLPLCSLSLRYPCCQWAAGRSSSFSLGRNEEISSSGDGAETGSIYFFFCIWVSLPFGNSMPLLYVCKFMKWDGSYAFVCQTPILCDLVLSLAVRPGSPLQCCRFVFWSCPLMQPSPENFVCRAGRCS